MDTQKDLQQNKSSKKIKMTWFIAAIIVVLLVISAVYIWKTIEDKLIRQSLYQQVKNMATETATQTMIPTITPTTVQPSATLSSDNQEEISLEQKYNDNTHEVTIVTNATNDWQQYEDKAAGFSFSYPANTNESEQDTLPLTIKSEKIETLNYTMKYDKETAEKDQQELIEGNYGIGPDWALSVSKKVVNLGSVNGQEFMVLSRFDTADVCFERKLIFYHNGYQTVITLTGNSNGIIANNDQFFEKMDEEYGDKMVWNFDKRDQFYQDLANGSLSGDAQAWFDLFDEIVSTINIE